MESETFREKVRLILLEKLVLALVVGALLFLGNFVITDRLAKKSTLYEARSEHLGETWASVYRFGREVGIALDGGGKMPDLEAFREGLIRSGVFLGKDRVSDIDDRLIVPLAELFVLDEKNEGVSTRFFQDWNSILAGLESDLR